jgi:hypothetical protein
MSFIEGKKFYAIKPPTADMLTDFPFSESMAITKERAWQKFCSPGLSREGYEADGFTVVKVRMTLEEI